MPGSADELRNILRRMDGRGYKAYRDIRGSFDLDHEGLTLYVDHVQGDPFAAPSKLRLRMARDVSRIPEDLDATVITDPKPYVTLWLTLGALACVAIGGALAYVTL